MRLLVLASQRMDYREVYRLARLANSGSVKGHGGIEWTAASSKPPEPEPKQPKPPKPKRWRWRKPPLDSS
jgi:hypothetical protein